jgi:hypothetical protein
MVICNTSIVNAKFFTGILWRYIICQMSVYKVSEVMTRLSDQLDANFSIDNISDEFNRLWRIAILLLSTFGLSYCSWAVKNFARSFNGCESDVTILTCNRMGGQIKFQASSHFGRLDWRSLLPVCSGSSTPNAGQMQRCLNADQRKL